MNANIPHVTVRYFAYSIAWSGFEPPGLDSVGCSRFQGWIYVADDGPGITEKEREQVFESCYTIVEDRAGLGLAIVEEIVEAHGWQIDVTASNTGGARVEITGVELIAD